MRNFGDRLWIGAVLAAGALGAAPTVTVTSVTQDAVRHRVTVNYELSEDAIVTASLASGGRTLAAPRVWGDVQAAVPGGARSFSWTPADADDCVGHAVTFTVSAWDPADPPDYLVCDLDLGTRAHYATTNDLPEGVGSDLYRTSKLLLRRIPAANQVFSCLGKYPMSLSEDFWIGVFETTQEQYRRILSAEPGTFAEATAWPTRPVTGRRAGSAPQLFHKTLRGDLASATVVPDAPAESSFFGILRTKAGLAFDLPTEAQWEFACRAGSETLLPPGVESPLDIGRFAENGGLPTGWTQADAYLCGDTNGTARVGSYPANAYGLYDMLGNVWEWCLDGFADDMGLADTQTAQVDYVNRAVPSSGDRVRRGGCWRDILSSTYNDYRSYWHGGLDNAGFRCAGGGITGTTRQPSQTVSADLAALADGMAFVDADVTPLERRMGTAALSPAIVFRSTPAAVVLIIR